MAQKTATRTAVVVSAAQRKTALSVVRGVQLAIHSAAGLVKDVDVESLRLLRVCEGLVRAAAGRLEALGRSTLVEAEKETAKSAKADDKANTQPFQDKGKGKKGKKKKAKNNRNDADMNEGNADLPTAVAATGVLRSLSSAAATFVPMQTGLDDEWADSLPQVFGPAPAPVGYASSLPGNASSSGPPGPRMLVARRSGSRSPRGEDLLIQPSPSADGASPLLAGHIAAIVGLESRPELAGAHVVLVEFDPAASRWICQTKSKEKLRIKPEKLQSFTPGLQKFAQRKFEAVEDVV
jgi:hypothetical protein